MTSPALLLILISLIGITVICIYRFIRNRNTAAFVFQLIAIALISAVIYKFFFVSAFIISKGEGNIAVVIKAYAVMLFGMFSTYLYSYCAKPQEERPPFDFGLFVAPMFLSPIIFLPLYLAFQDTQSLTDKAQIGIFIVAFQNGFFWKEYLDKVRKEKEKDIKG